MNRRRPQSSNDPPPLAPEIVRIIEALAVAAARRDHEKEIRERKQ